MMSPYRRVTEQIDALPLVEEIKNNETEVF
jgi:hypothetical protein